MTRTKRQILVVDDDQQMVDYLVEMLEEAGYAARGTSSPKESIGLIAASDFDLVISDVEMPQMRGLDLLAAVHAKRPGQLVLLITAFGTIDLAVQAVRAGACDFITKPFKFEALCHAIERAFRERTMRREVVRLRGMLTERADGGLIANSPPMKRALDLARRAAQTDSTVLLTGESGTGKSALARYIHEHSARRSGPFVHLNCSAIPMTLVESELFGARKGAFTDAREERTGLFVQASGGTLFLDEIGEMPMEAQPKLLHALETGHIRKVGGGSDIAIDARVVASTNRPLEEALRERRFRPDLYYRLNIIRIEIPPLRERPEDIDALVDVFLHRASEKLGRQIVGLTAEAVRWLKTYGWPGNARELSNLLERAVALSDHDTLTLSDFEQWTARPDFLTDGAVRRLPLADIERAYVRRILESTGGNKSQAARILGIDRRTLHRKIELPDQGEDEQDEEP
jgi:DNA-binding NtrC family response regulator